MTITDNLLTKGSAHGRPGTKLTPIGILIHYVGNPNSTAVANRNYFENTGVASAHYIVGLQGEILRCIPEDEVAWHAGKSYAAQYDDIAKTNNSKYLGIETCHPDTTGRFSDVTYKSLVELVTDICVRRGFDANTAVMRHYDVTGKICPLYYVRNDADWAQMKSDILASIKGHSIEEGELKESEMRYNTIDEMPSWAQPTIKKLCEKGYLSGNGKGLNLSEDMLRLFVINDRAGLY